jgi:molecular chaperone GrpE
MAEESVENIEETEAHTEADAQNEAGSESEVDVEAGEAAEETAAAEDSEATEESEAVDAPSDESSDDHDADGGPELEILEDPATAEIQRLEGVIEELQGRLRAVSAAYQKQQAEVAATRTRLERQAAVKEELRRGEVVAGLFDPVENLKRSMDAVRKGASNEDTLQGLELVLKAFMGSFEKLGLEEVPGKGAAFDPNIHEALTAIPVTDPSLDQVVMEVFSTGYRIGSRLIAPAKVIVGAYQEPAGEA